MQLLLVVRLGEAFYLNSLPKGNPITIKKEVMKKEGKQRRWTQADEDILISNVEKHVLCLQKAFNNAAKVIHRSPKAVAAHWYQKTSRNSGRTLFATVSGRHVAVNRKNGSGEPLKKGIFMKILSLLKLR